LLRGEWKIRVYAVAPNQYALEKNLLQRGAHEVLSTKRSSCHRSREVRTSYQGPKISFRKNIGPSLWLFDSKGKSI